jgi:hypothetical protein
MSTYRSPEFQERKVAVGHKLQAALEHGYKRLNEPQPSEEDVENLIWRTPQKKRGLLHQRRIGSLHARLREHPIERQPSRLEAQEELFQKQPSANMGFLQNRAPARK